MLTSYQSLSYHLLRIEKIKLKYIKIRLLEITHVCLYFVLRYFLIPALRSRLHKIKPVHLKAIDILVIIIHSNDNINERNLQL